MDTGAGSDVQNPKTNSQYIQLAYAWACGSLFPYSINHVQFRQNQQVRPLSVMNLDIYHHRHIFAAKNLIYWPKWNKSNLKL